ncbi:MAG: Gx transporter family protein [Desulfuromonadales bacterium]|jgi:heptaprenyl diphosphate synthase
MTCSAVDPKRLAAARRRVFLALFIALAVSVHILEALLPSPIPWLRPGLANGMTLVALYLYDGHAAWSVSLTRVGIGALLLGRLFSPGFWLALAGALAATAVMVLLHCWAGRRLSPIGVSVAGAASHVCGQVLIARWLILRHDALWQVLPPLLLFAVLSGILTGWLATLLIDQIGQHPAFKTVPTGPGKTEDRVA